MTERHIDDAIGDLLLGDVSDGERVAMEAHAAGCARCGQALVAATEAFALVGAGVAANEIVPPPPSLRAKILADAAAASAEGAADAPLAPRTARFVDQLASLFDITRKKARALLDRLDSPEAWMPGPVPNSSVLLVDGAGPKLDGAFAGFVKMGASVDWPAHTHLGTEHMLVLAGGFKQDDGVEVHPGTVHTMTEGSCHAFRIFDDEPCIAAAVVFGGVKFDDPGYTLSGVSQ
jgi:putative transcriptional regulator